MKLHVVALLLFCLSFTLAFSNPVWEQTNGPYAAQLIYIISDSQGYLYTITFSGNLYKSTNLGDIWTKLPVENVIAIAFDKDNNCLIGNRFSEIYLYDKELNFLKSLHVPYLGKSWVNQIQIAKNDYIFARFDSHLILSTDNGQSWKKIYYELYFNFFIDSGNVIIITWYSGTIGRSSDYGQNWENIKIYDPQLNSGINNGAYNKCTDNFIIGCEDSIIYISSDKGISWNKIKDSIPLKSIYDVMIDKNCDVYALGDDVCRSTDGGNSWIKLKGLTGNSINSITILDNKMYGSSGSNGIIKYDFNNESTTLNNNGILNSRINCIDINQIGVVFGATQSGIFKTTNSGVEWKKLNYKHFQTIHLIQFIVLLTEIFILGMIPF